MLTSIAGICALRKLRKAWQEDAGGAYPEAVLTELLVLYDVCTGLELNIFQIKDVFGETAWEGIKHYLDSPIVIMGDTNLIELGLE